MVIVYQLGAMRTSGAVCVCPACDGTGSSLEPAYDEDRNEVEPCSYCGGNGYTIMQNSEANEQNTGGSNDDGRL